MKTNTCRNINTDTWLHIINTHSRPQAETRYDYGCHVQFFLGWWSFFWTFSVERINYGTNSFQKSRHQPISWGAEHQRHQSSPLCQCIDRVLHDHLLIMLSHTHTGSPPFSHKVKCGVRHIHQTQGLSTPSYWDVSYTLCLLLLTLDI